MINPSVRSHWFYIIAPLIVAVDLAVALNARGEFDRILEAGLLFDFVVLVPSLYWLCYRRQGRKAAVRAAALVCLGIWAAIKLVPPTEQDLVLYVAPLRYVALAVLVALEAVVLVAIYRSVFSGQSAQEAAAAASKDLPPWVARLMALEATLWHKAWTAVKRILGRR